MTQNDPTAEDREPTLEEQLDAMYDALSEENAVARQSANSVGTPDDEWLVDWFMRTIDEANRAIEDLKRRQNQWLNRQGMLWLRFGTAFREAAKKRVPKGQKQVKTPYGMVGERKENRPSIDIHDTRDNQRVMVAWCKANGLLDACDVLVKRNGPILDWLKENPKGELPQGMTYKGPRVVSVPKAMYPKDVQAYRLAREEAEAAARQKDES